MRDPAADAATTAPDVLLHAGMQIQRARRQGLDALPTPQRRHTLEQQMLQLARTLKVSHLGYSEHLAGIDEITRVALPSIDKDFLRTRAAAFCGAAGIELPAARHFLDRPFELGSRFDDQRVLFRSSGSTGGALLVPYHLIDLGRSLDAFTARAVAVDRPTATRMLYVGLLDRHNGGNAWMHHLGSVLRVRMADLFDDPAHLLETIMEFEPDVVLTRPHMLLLLGELARARGRLLPPAHLLSVGDRLTRGAARDIAELWGARPHNSYSTVETGPLGYQRDADVDCLDVYDDLHLVELLDDDGRPIDVPGVRGRIAVTTLYRLQFPLVRYLIGDTAEWVDETKCGITFPVRDGVEELVLELGDPARRVAIRESEVAARMPEGVRDVQLVQSGPDALLVRYTCTHSTSGTPSTSTIEDALRHELEALLAQRVAPGRGRAAIAVQRVAALEPDRRSGKVKHLLSIDGA